MPFRTELFRTEVGDVESLDRVSFRVAFSALHVAKFPYSRG